MLNGRSVGSSDLEVMGLVRYVGIAEEDCITSNPLWVINHVCEYAS